MHFHKNSLSEKANLVKDLIGILLTLIIGIGGLIVTSNPIRILIPKHPMISSQDWSGSRVTQQLNISTKNWEEYRILSIYLGSEYDVSGYNSRVDQHATWYADAEKAAAKWNRLYERTDWQLISENFISEDQPASRLYCKQGSSTSFYRVLCDFEAYRGHWWTQILFSSISDEQLSDAEIQEIVNRANQLLIDAAEEP